MRAGSSKVDGTTDARLDRLDVLEAALDAVGVDPGPPRVEVFLDLPRPVQTAIFADLAERETRTSSDGRGAALPSDAGFRASINAAYEAGHITHRERHERRLMHNLIVRARETERSEEQAEATVVELPTKPANSWLAGHDHADGGRAAYAAANGRHRLRRPHPVS